MSSHLFTFTVDHVEDAKGNQVTSAPLTFSARTHEDLFKIVEKMKQKLDFEEGDATTFAIGLKLFGEVLMKNRDKELFKQFKPHFAHFMKELKKS
jgi:hypothetical protein